MSQRDMAARALEAILSMAKDDARNKKFKTLCMKTPAMLAQSGLAQTVTFLRAREVRQGIGETFTEHLVRVLGNKEIRNAQELQKCAIEADLAEYMELSVSVSHALLWMRRFAQVEMAKIDMVEVRGDENHG